MIIGAKPGPLPPLVRPAPRLCCGELEVRTGERCPTCLEVMPCER